MTFPQTILDVTVKASIGGVWTDITSYVYKREVSIRYGADDESSETSPASCSFFLNNGDGRFSPRNPSGPYYGGFGRNTPLQVYVAGGDNYLDVPGAGYAQTADSAQISITGDIDIRVDASLRDWSAQEDNGQTELIGKLNITGNQRSWAVWLVNGKIMYEWSTAGTTTTQVTSTVGTNPDPSGRLAIRVTHDVNNGASGNTVTFYTAPTMDGPWELLGDAVTNSGTTSIFDSTAPLKVGDATDVSSFTVPTGRIHEAKVLSGINGTVAAHVNFANEALASASFTADDGLTWTVAGGAEIKNQQVRFRGEVTAWPSRWDTGGFDVWVEIEGHSLLRRYGQGTKALESTMRRRIPTDSTILAYWPMEDGEDATQFYSPMEGVLPLTFTGDVNPAGHPGPDGSKDLPSFGTGSSWYGSVPGPDTSADAYQVEWIVNVQQAVATAHTIQRFGALGTVRLLSFRVDSGGAQIDGRDRTGTVVFSQSTVLDMSEHINNWVRWQFRAEQNGGNVDYAMTWVPIGGVGGTVTGSYAGTVGRITSVSGLDSFPASLDGLAWGQLAVFNTDLTLIYNDADIAFAGESARDRFIRLVGEEGVPYQLIGEDDNTPNMGPQRPSKLLSLLQECADADRGILADSRDDITDSRFVFIHKDALYNGRPRLILGYQDDGEVHAPLDPTDDDLYVRNDVTATRVQGSSARVEQLTGRNSTLEPPNGIGSGYDSEVEVNVHKDEQLIHHAGWEVHLGTWDEERYPTVLLKLQAAPSLIPNAVFLFPGTRIRITDLPAWLPPGDIELMVRGYEETLAQYTWEIQLQCVPARPWDAAKLEWLTRITNKLDTDGSELAEALDTTETAIDIQTTTYPTWTDDSEEFPYSLVTGGERMIAVVPGGFTNTNPFFHTSVTGWTGTSCTPAHETAIVHPHPHAVGSMKVTPAGGVAAPVVDSDLTSASTINPGGRYKISGWFYSPLGWSDLRPYIHWYTSGDAFISSSGAAQAAVAAGVWTYFEDTVTAPATANKCKMSARIAGTPAATDIFYVWNLKVNRIVAGVVYDEFGRTDTDTWSNADSGQTWSTSGGVAGNFDVTSGYGSHTLTTTNVRRIATITAPSADVDLYADITTSATATGASLQGVVAARYADVDNQYLARLDFSTANVVTLTLRKRVAGVETQLGTYTLSYTHVAGTFLTVRLQVTGSTVRAKAWASGAGWVEPGPWHIEATDTALTAAGSVGLWSIASTGNTNVNPQVRFDNFEMANPQTYTVERSVDGIVKSHSAGADINLYYPMITGL
jgi:hypothetical protein